MRFVAYLPSHIQRALVEKLAIIEESRVGRGEFGRSRVLSTEAEGQGVKYILFRVFFKTTLHLTPSFNCYLFQIKEIESRKSETRIQATDGQVCYKKTKIYSK